MKTALIFLAIGVILLIAIVSGKGSKFRRSAVDIHLHDTYFILSYFSFSITILLILATLFFLGGTIGTAFKNKSYLFPLLILILTGTHYIVKLTSFFKQQK